MIRRSPTPWLPWLLGMLTLLALVSVAPQRPVTFFIDPRISIVMIGLVAFVVNVEVPLLRDSISLGYAAGLLVYLSLGRAEGSYEAFGVIAIGAMMGGLLRALWIVFENQRGFRLHRYLIEWPMMAASQLTLSLIAGGMAYRAMNGRLPLNALRAVDAIPLAVLIVVSAALYLGIYALAVRWRGLKPQDVFAQNRVAIALAIVLPMPLVIVAALLFTQSIGGSAVLIIGLLCMAIGATELGRGQLRYRQQVVELRSLSAVNSAMRTHLDLGVLMETIHLQVATLLEVQMFTLALYDQSRNLLIFPLSTRHWQRINIPPREMGMDIIDHVIVTKAPLLLAQNPAQRARAMGLVPPAGNLTSWLGVPLLAPDRALGCIAVGLDDPYRQFTARDQRLLVAIATQSSIAIENAQLYRQVQERARQLAHLNNLSTQLGGTLDPDRVLDMVAQAALTVAEASSVAVFVWTDEAHQTLKMVRSWGLSEHFSADVPTPLSLESGLQPLVIQNARLDPRAAGIYDVMRREQINAWIELPMWHGDTALGILVAYYREPRPFTDDEIELLRTFANQSALSISNARLYRQTDEALERRIEQISALASINKELSSTLNLNNIFELVLDRAIEATRSTGGAITVRTSGQFTPTLVASRGDTHVREGHLMQQHTVSQAYATGQTVVERNGKLSDSTAEQLRAQLSVPLVRDFDVLGVLTLESQAVDAYPQDDIAFVSQLANLASIAIENARVFEWIQESHNRLQVILDSMHEAVILFEMDGKVALANPRVLLLLGIDPASIVGERLDVILSRTELSFAERLGFPDRETLMGLFETLALSAWQGGGRLSYRLERGPIRFIDRTIVAVSDQNGKNIGLLMVFNDATEERELAQTREDLSRMIVHDLRSPLTAISTSMKLLSEIVPADDPVGRSVKKTTEVSQRALRKLLHLVDSLLDIAKMESGNMTLEIGQFELRPIAESVRAELAPLAEELDITVDIIVPDDLPPLAIDGNKIERVLLNLVDNALKFTPVGGLVQIRARCTTDNRVLVEVLDNGPGIPDDYKVRIFERFQQIDTGNKGHRRGTGLGLTFCRLTVEAHGGTIWIEDNPTGGSVFALTLPLAAG